MDENNLIWIDLEMTGLDTVNDEIIEIATIVTDKDLNEVQFNSYSMLSPVDSNRTQAALRLWARLEFNCHGRIKKLVRWV